MDQWLKFGSLLKRKNSDSGDGDLVNENTACSSKSAQQEVPKHKIRKCRRYIEDYLSLGFTYTGSQDDQRPQCVICYETLSNECMKPAKLRRHLETKHNDYAKKSVEFFQNKRRELLASKKTIEKTAHASNNENAVLASYKVALLVAKKGKPHTIAEDLILPAAKTMVSTMLGDKAAKELDLISLSNDTIKRRVDDMSTNIKEELISRIRKSQYYAIQLDESTDIGNNAHLLTFIRYEFDNKINEDFLFCHALPTHTTADAIYNSLNNFITTNNIEWSKCVAITSDGARAMSGKNTGLVARIKTVVPTVKWTHCCIHREALAVKKMPQHLKTALDEVVKVVNFIKARALNSRIFSILCEEMGSEHQHLLLHAEVRWLSRGKVLTRVFELRDEIRIFFTTTEFQLGIRFNDFAWLALIAYLADIFTHLNELNLSLQGANVTIFKVEDRVQGMIKKIELWTHRMRNQIYGSFPTLSDFLETSDDELSFETREIFIEHLETLKRNFRDYFPVPDSNNDWIRNPFIVNLKEIKGLTIAEQDTLAELSCDTSLKLMFNEHALTDFWLRLRFDYAELSQKALMHLLPFCTTYLCERAFSTLVYIKSKYRNRLKNVEPELRLKLSTFEPNISNLISVKQHHPSH